MRPTENRPNTRDGVWRKDVLREVRPAKRRKKRHAVKRHKRHAVECSGRSALKLRREKVEVFRWDRVSSAWRCGCGEKHQSKDDPRMEDWEKTATATNKMMRGGDQLRIFNQETQFLLTMGIVKWQRHT